MSTDDAKDGKAAGKSAGGGIGGALKSAAAAKAAAGKAEAPKAGAGLSAALSGMAISAGGAGSAAGGEVEENKATVGGDDDGETIVTPDPSDHNIRHPLQNTWTMYYTAPQTGRPKSDAKAWSNNVKKIIDFGFVEDFWR